MRIPIFVLLSGISAGLLVVLNANLQPRELDREQISKAQSLVATGEGNVPQLLHASAIAAEFLARDHSHPQALFVQAWAQQRLGQPSEAISNYQELLRQIDDLSKYAHFNVGVLLADKGTLDMAIAHFLAATSIDPSMDTAWARTAQILIKLGRYHEARDVISNGLETSPSSVELLSLQERLTTLQAATPPTENSPK